MWILYQRRYDADISIDNGVSVTISAYENRNEAVDYVFEYCTYDKDKVYTEEQIRVVKDYIASGNAVCRWAWRRRGSHILFVVRNLDIDKDVKIENLGRIPTVTQILKKEGLW